MTNELDEWLNEELDEFPHTNSTQSIAEFPVSEPLLETIEPVIQPLKELLRDYAATYFISPQTGFSNDFFRDVTNAYKKIPDNMVEYMRNFKEWTEDPEWEHAVRRCIKIVEESEGSDKLTPLSTVELRGQLLSKLWKQRSPGMSLYEFIEDFHRDYKKDGTFIDNIKGFLKLVNVEPSTETINAAEILFKEEYDTLNEQDPTIKEIEAQLKQLFPRGMEETAWDEWRSAYRIQACEQPLRLNLLGGMGAMLAVLNEEKDEGIAAFRNLSGKIDELCLKQTDKTARISQSLIQATEENVTFMELCQDQHGLGERLGEESAAKKPVIKAFQDAVGEHQNLFKRILHYIFPEYFKTKTQQFFESAKKEISKEIRPRESDTGTETETETKTIHL